MKDCFSVVSFPLEIYDQTDLPKDLDRSKPPFVLALLATPKLFDKVSADEKLKSHIRELFIEATCAEYVLSSLFGGVSPEGEKIVVGIVRTKPYPFKDKITTLELSVAQPLNALLQIGRDLQ